MNLIEITSLTLDAGHHRGAGVGVRSGGGAAEGRAVRDAALELESRRRPDHAGAHQKVIPPTPPEVGNRQN